jgi:hypothetical protein
MSMEDSDTKYEKYFKDKIKRPTSSLASECSKNVFDIVNTECMISRIDKNSRTNVKAILGTRDGVCFQK